MASSSEEDTKTVTDEDIKRVTDELGPDELHHLFDNLGIPKHRVEIAEKSADTTDVVLKAREVLRQWKKNKGSAATQKALFEARDIILKKRKGKSSRGSNEEFNLQECQDQLRELYLGPDMKVQLTPWDPDHAVYMDAIYVNLELMKDEESASEIKQTPLQKNEDLVIIQTPTGQRVNRILIQGEAGSGKSTLLNNLAYKWALQLDPAQSSTSSLSQFDLVFIIRVNEINDINNSIEQIIFDQILEDGENVSQTSLKSYLQSNAQKCLFLIDGLNEDSVGILNSSTADISKVLYNKMYIRSCAIASIRPYKVQAMGHNQSKFKKVELTAFSDKNIEEYIKKYFAEKEVDYASLLQRLKKEPHIWELAGTPLLLLFFCVLWDDPIQANRSLPNTRTKLYHETIASLWKRYHYEKLGISEELVASDTQKLQLANFLETLGQVTLVGLLNDQDKEKVLFKDSDFEETTCFMLALRIGILTKERFRSKLHMKTSVKFLHTSIQDFCSAVYIANLHLKDNKKCKDYVAKLLKYTRLLCNWSDRYLEVLVFCAGYKPDTVKLITEGFVKEANHQSDCISPELFPPIIDTIILDDPLDSTRWDSMERKESILLERPTINVLFMFVFEAQLTYVKCQELVSILSSAVDPLLLLWSLATEKYIQFQLNLLKPVNETNTVLLFSTLFGIHISEIIEFPKFYSLIVSMLKYSKQLQSFILHFDTSQVSELSEIFDELADMQDLWELVLHRKLKHASTHGNVDISNTLHKICHLKIHLLELSNVTVTAKSMTEFLCSNNSRSLVSLILVIPPDCIHDPFSLMTAISNIKTLYVLSLGGFAIGRGVKCFKSIIPQLKTLLLYTSFDAWNVHELVSYLGKAKKLNSLLFSGLFLGTAVNNLADQLKHMDKLKRLNLRNTGLGNHGCQILAEGIKTMSSLCGVNLLDNPEIGLEGKQAIENLRTLPKFHELQITFDRTPEMITMMQTLQELPRTEFDNLLQALDNPFDRSLYPIVQKVNQKAQTRLQDCSTNSSTVEMSISPVKLASNSYKPLPGQEGVQDPFLPDCRNCMFQIYNAVIKPIIECCNPTCMRLETGALGGLKRCLWCKMKRCLWCKMVWYCRWECQRDHWEIHRSACRKQQNLQRKMRNLNLH